MFIDKYCYPDVNGYVLYNKLYTLYINYLNVQKKRRVKMIEFKSALEDEGYYVEKTNKKVETEYISSRFVVGLNLKTNCDFCDDCDTSSTQCYTRVNLSENGVTNVTNVTNLDSQLSKLNSKKLYTYEELYNKFGVEQKIFTTIFNTLLRDGYIAEFKKGLYSLLS